MAAFESPVLSPSLILPICPTLTHWVTPPKLLSTTKAVIFSFTAPVATSLIGVLAKTVKMSARPPLLWKNEVISIGLRAAGPGHRAEGKKRRNGRLPDPNLGSV